MYIVKTLCFAVIGLFRKPHTIRKVVIFLLCTGVFCVISSILAFCESQKPILSIFFHWLWVPMSLLLLIIRHGEVIRRYNIKRFFEKKEFFGYNGKIPRYIKTIIYNRYLVKVRFSSCIHFNEWEKCIPDLEMFFKKKIYKIENLRRKITIIDIFLIEEELPNFIEWDDSFMQDGCKFAIGQGYEGIVVWNAASLVHGIVAGATGGGKTALIRSVIYQGIKKKFNITVFDFKGGGDFTKIEREHQKYKDLEKGYGPIVVSDPEEARNILISLIVEVQGRMEYFKRAGVSNLEEFNALGGLQFIPWLLIIDEAAEILDVKPRDKLEKELYIEIDQSLRKLARLSRAAGVHILIGIIRPSTDILDGQIKNNLLWRACGYFADTAASQLVLESDKATELPPDVKGRFIIGNEEVQAYYLPILKEE